MTTVESGLVILIGLETGEEDEGAGTATLGSVSGHDIVCCCCGCSEGEDDDEDEEDDSCDCCCVCLGT